MTRTKKILLSICVFAIIISGLWFYWGWQVPLMDQLPDGTWTRVRVWKGGDTAQEQEWEIEPPELETVLAAMEQTKVDRNDKDKYLGAAYFRIKLYREESPQPTLIYVRESGKISFAVDYDLDHYQHYEHGEELYEALAILTADSAIKE